MIDDGRKRFKGIEHANRRRGRRQLEAVRTPLENFAMRLQKRVSRRDDEIDDERGENVVGQLSLAHRGVDRVDLGEQLTIDEKYRVRVYEMLKIGRHECAVLQQIEHVELNVQANVAAILIAHSLLTEETSFLSSSPVASSSTSE